MPSSPESEHSGHDERADGGTRTETEAEARTEAGPESRPEAEAPNREAELEDRYRRALADLDNYRKRSLRLVDQRVAEQRESLLLDWLEVVDSVERALRMEPPDTPGAAGMRAVLDQIESLLARNGVTRVGARGERFDPERHEAVGVRPSDELPDQTIDEVVRSGFALGDRTLRPALAVVARRNEPDG